MCTKKVSFRKKKQRRARPNEGKKHHAQSIIKRRLKNERGKKGRKVVMGVAYGYVPHVFCDSSPQKLQYGICNLEVDCKGKRKRKKTSNP